MYQFIYHIIYFLINPQFFTNIEQKNTFKNEFNVAFKKGDFRKSIAIFEEIEKVNRLIEPELRLDAAHAYFVTNDTLNARINYEHTQDLPNALQASQSCNQLGVLAITRGDSSEGLKYFKKAIGKNIDLEQARYNYELISKLYKPKASPPPEQQQSKQNQEILASDKKEQDLDEYTSKKISKEKALQLLEDLKNSEIKILISKKNSKQNLEKDW
jgi:tetratricopeptide (TPR) repeat protein